VTLTNFNEREIHLMEEDMYMDSLDREFREMLLNSIDSMIEPPILDIFSNYIRRVRLLKMPSRDSLKMLGDTADYFRDGDDDPDGDSLLIPVKFFDSSELAAAISAGGKIVEGYEFSYPRSIVHSSYGMERQTEHQEHQEHHEWCGYKSAGVGYALAFDVAEAIWATSAALAAEDQD